MLEIGKHWECALCQYNNLQSSVHINDDVSRWRARMWRKFLIEYEPSGQSLWFPLPISWSLTNLSIYFISMRERIAYIMIYKHQPLLYVHNSHVFSHTEEDWFYLYVFYWTMLYRYLSHHSICSFQWTHLKFHQGNLKRNVRGNWASCVYDSIDLCCGIQG